MREQPSRMCKSSNPKMECDSVIGQHLIKNPECNKIYKTIIFGLLGKQERPFS